MKLMYVELKSGYNDDGPAWIGWGRESKTGRTLYFNGHAFQHVKGYAGNYVDVETDEVYWISGPKKDGSDRHWAGHGPIVVAQSAVEEYLCYIGATSLNPHRYVVEDINDAFPVERINQLMNE